MWNGLLTGNRDNVGGSEEVPSSFEAQSLVLP
jgi:hypothetical protein